MRHILPQILVKSQPLLLLYLGSNGNNIQQIMAVYSNNFNGVSLLNYKLALFLCLVK